MSVSRLVVTSVFVPIAVLLATLVPVRSAQATESFDACAGVIASLPVTIATQGVWCLTKDLSTSITSGAAITVATNNVTIDCNGFKLGGLGAGNASQAVGIGASARQNTTVRNCNIRGFLSGVDLRGAGHLVEDNRFDNNLRSATVVVGSNNTIRRNLMYDTGGSTSSGYAAAVDANANIIDNTITGVFGPSGFSIYGIAHGNGGGVGSVIRDNRVSGLVSSGSTVIGIMASAASMEVSRNHVVATPAVTGSGIQTSSAFCVGNTVTGFSTAFGGCGASSANLSL